MFYFIFIHIRTPTHTIRVAIVEVHVEHTPFVYSRVHHMMTQIQKFHSFINFTIEHIVHSPVVFVSNSV